LTPRRALLAGAAVAAVLAACGPREGAPETIVVATAVDMRGVNELTAGASFFHTALHYYALFLTLLDEQPDYESGPPSLTPRLASSYELSGDRRVLTFKLRRDVVWSDGVPVTAEDVRWTWQAQTHPEVAWHLAGAKRHVRDVEVVDPFTVRFHFDRAYGTQLLDANLGVILPRHAWSRLPFSAWRRDGGWFLDHLVVAGPFTVESWEPDRRLVLRRNERYFQPHLPRAERIVFRVTPDRQSQLALLRTGAAHVIDAARPAELRQLGENPDVVLASYLPRGSYALVWNLARPLFASREVRLALTLAIDRQAIVDALLFGDARLTESPFPSDLWACNRSLRPRPYDPGSARELLAAEGWSDSDGDGVLDRGGERFSFEILTEAGSELRRDVVVMVQHQLARLGVEALPRPLEFNTLLDRERRHDFAATLSSLGIGTDLDLSYYFHSRSIDEGYNLGAYADPEVDRLLDEIKAQVDQLAAKPLYDRLQTLLYDDVPLTFLYEPWRRIPVRRELADVSPNALSPYFGLERWRLRPGP